MTFAFPQNQWFQPFQKLFYSHNEFSYTGMNINTELMIVLSDSYSKSLTVTPSNAIQISSNEFVSFIFYSDIYSQQYKSDKKADTE